MNEQPHCKGTFAIKKSFHQKLRFSLKLKFMFTKISLCKLSLLRSMSINFFIKTTRASLSYVMDTVPEEEKKKTRIKIKTL